MHIRDGTYTNTCPLVLCQVLETAAAPRIVAMLPRLTIK
jgi:hypothetical protein